MRRRIALSLLLFCLTVMTAMVFTASYALRQGYIDQTRQSMDKACRVLSTTYQAGMYAAQLNMAMSSEGAGYTVFSGEEVPQSGLGVAVEQARREGTGWAVYMDDQSAYTSYMSEPYLVQMAASARLLDNGDVFVLFSPFRDVQSTAIHGNVWLIFAGILVLSVLFALFLSSTFTRPISKLTSALRDIMQGNFDKRVSVHTQDELGQLGESFNAMADRLQQTIEQLNHKSAEIESIISAMNNGLIAVDEQMHVIRLNPAARRMFDVHGNPYNKYVLDVTRNAKLESHLVAAMEQGELYAAELPVRVNQENRLLRLYITGLQQENQSIGALALIEDITELRRLEQVRVDFVANVTHELKTPLTSIRGFVETLQQGAIDDPDAARRFLSIIAMESERLTRLIDDILHLSSLEGGRRRETVEQLSFAPFVQQICELLQSTAREKNITLSLEDTSRGACIMASADKVKQLLINLIDNAIKYTLNDGHVWVGVKTEADQVVLTVRDDGIGIEKEHIPRLFERFYRVDKGRSRSMGGTGLGLAIVKHIVREMNGSIDVESDYGAGSMFTVRLPISTEEENPE